MKRLLEKNRTYRVPRTGGGYDLYHLISVEADSITLRNQQTNKIENKNKKEFQSALDAGKIYVAAKNVEQALYKVLMGMVISHG